MRRWLVNNFFQSLFNQHHPGCLELSDTTALLCSPASRLNYRTQGSIYSDKCRCLEMQRATCQILATKSRGAFPKPCRKQLQMASHRDKVPVFSKTILASELDGGFQRGPEPLPNFCPTLRPRGAAGAQSANGDLWYRHPERPAGAKEQDTGMWEKH